MYGCVFCEPVGDFNANTDILRVGLCILDKNIELAIVIENACVEEFKLGFLPAATATIFFN